MTPSMKNRKVGCPLVDTRPMRPKTTVKISVVITGGITNQSGPSTVCL
ncbi:MAG: hypothetical protein WDN28_28980 [Chthoniobacter sp.]